MKFVLFLLSFSLSVQAGCMFSICRRPSVIIPEPLPVQVPERPELKSIHTPGQAQAYPASLRRKRLRRHVKFAMINQFIREKQAEIQDNLN